MINQSTLQVISCYLSNKTTCNMLTSCKSCHHFNNPSISRPLSKQRWICSWFDTYKPLL